MLKKNFFVIVVCCNTLIEFRYILNLIICWTRVEHVLYHIATLLASPPLYANINEHFVLIKWTEIECMKLTLHFNFWNKYNIIKKKTIKNDTQTERHIIFRGRNQTVNYLVNHPLFPSYASGHPVSAESSFLPLTYELRHVPFEQSGLDRPGHTSKDIPRATDICIF